MENVSLKLESTIARQVEKAMRAHRYSTKTEFIRDAIRCRLQALSEEAKKERAWDALFAARGILKGKGRFKTDEEWYAWRHGEGSRQLLAEMEKKFGLNQK